MKIKINKICLLLIICNLLLSSGCATKFEPVSDTGAVNPMLAGGKSDAMKFPILMDYSQLTIQDPKIRSITHVAKQSTTATVVILYPPNYLKLAEKVYTVISQANVKVMRPIQSAIISGGVSDDQNIYVYVTFTPIIVPQNIQESANVKY